MYTKRQITEAKKRHEKISDLMSEKAHIDHLGIDFERGEMYFCDKDNYYKEYIYGTFNNYKELRNAQNYMILLLSSIDQVVISKYENLQATVNRELQV